MPLTIGTIQPIAPYSGQGGNQKVAPIIPFLAGSAATTYRTGDIITASSGKAIIATAGQASPDQTIILGVVATGRTTGAAVNDRDYIGIVPATLDQVFEANWCNATAATDDQLDVATDSFHGYDISGVAVDIDPSSAVYNVGVVDSGAATPEVAFVHGPSPSQIRGQNFVNGASGTLNPRVLFTFVDSMFITPPA